VSPRLSKGWGARMRLAYIFSRGSLAGAGLAVREVKLMLALRRAGSDALRRSEERGRVILYICLLVHGSNRMSMHGGWARAEASRIPALFCVSAVDVRIDRLFPQSIEGTAGLSLHPLHCHSVRLGPAHSWWMAHLVVSEERSFERSKLGSSTK
jgi:hypothetical protein